MIKLVNNVSEANAITHGGIFHSDEVLATVILNKVFKNLKVCRVFEVPEGVSETAVVYDIGHGKFDHHQLGGNGARENGVPYASVGLIWKEFGRKLVKGFKNADLVWEIVDRDLIQGVDAVDNGTMPKLDYPAHSMSFSGMISSFNPNWDSNEKSDQAFLKAVNFAETVFDNVLENAVSKAKAKSIVEEAILRSEGHVLVLENFVPWQEFVLSSENQKAKEIEFAIFPSLRGGYNWQCVPDEMGSFGQRKPVPEEWKGLNGSDLQKVTGVKGATFCHKAGFIGGAETKEDALALTRIAVLNNRKETLKQTEYSLGD